MPISKGCDAYDGWLVQGAVGPLYTCHRNLYQPAKFITRPEEEGRYGLLFGLRCGTSARRHVLSLMRCAGHPIDPDGITAVDRARGPDTCAPAAVRLGPTDDGRVRWSPAGRAPVDGPASTTCIVCAASGAGTTPGA